MQELFTLKGSKIWYSKFGVGKQIGSKIYFHKNYWKKIIPIQDYNKAIKILTNNNLSIDSINTICYDFTHPFIIRFDTCEDFNLVDEPVVGTMYFVNIIDEKVAIKNNKQIFHHKWLWVNQDYTGFDVRQSWERSKLWLSKLKGIASGYPDKWEIQLNLINMK